MTTSPYLLYQKLVEEGKVNIEEAEIDFIIREFLDYSNQLQTYGLFKEASRFIEAITKLFVLKVNLLTNEFFALQSDDTICIKERKRYISKKIEEVLRELDLIEDQELLKIFSEYRRKTGRKQKHTPNTISKLDKRKTPEFKLTKSVDYILYAKVVMEQISSGKFKIKTVEDFFGFLFAVSIYSLDISQEEYRRFIRWRY